MNPVEVMPMIDPLDAALVPFLADPNQDDRKKSDARSRRDNINRIITDAGDAMRRTSDDYKKRIQSEIDAINRIMQP